MSVPAPSQLRFLRPGVWIQEVVLLRIDVLGEHQPPVINQISAHRDEIFRKICSPSYVATQSVCRLIDANDETSGESPCELAGRQTNATTGVQYQWHIAVCFPGSDASGESFKIDCRNRLAESRRCVFCDDHLQLFMHAGLIASDRS